MPICASIGQAAGIAASLARDGTAIADVDVSRVQQLLGASGGLF